MVYALQLSHRFVKQHDLHPATGRNLDLVSEEDLRSRRHRPGGGVASPCGYTHDLATKGGGHADKFSGNSGQHPGKERYTSEERNTKQAHEKHQNTRNKHGNFA